MIGVGISPSLMQGSAASLDPAVVTYAAAVGAAGGTLTGGQKAALSAFTVRCRALGLWTKLTEMGVFLGGTLGSAAVKYKTIGAANCVLNNFVLARPDQCRHRLRRHDEVDRHGDDGDASLGTGADDRRDGHGRVPDRRVHPDHGRLSDWHRRGQRAAGGPTLECDLRGLLDLLIQGGGVPQWIKSRGILPIGLISGHRNGATSVFGYEGGVNISGGNAGFTYTASANQYAVCSGFFGNNKIAMSCGMYYLGDGTWTDADLTNFAQVCNQLMVALGRVVPDARPFNYVPIIGQSLATGSQGNPPLSTTQPYKNWTVGSGEIGNLNLTPPTQFWNGGGSGNGYQIGDSCPMIELFQETIQSGAANTISQKARANSLGSTKDTFSANFALGATAYSGLAKGTNPYANHLASAAYFPVAGILMATGAMTVPAIWCVHGESDMANGSYDLNIRQWQVDLQTDLSAITGQVSTIPIFHSQPSCWTDLVNTNSATGVSPFLILNESRVNPTKTLCVCPKYFFTYSTNANQQIHLINSQYRLLGEYYGKAHYQHVVQGVQWIPLRIKTITRTGAVLHVTFEGNVGNIQLDTTTVTDPSGALNTKGFEYVDSSSPSNYYSNISSVAITGSNTMDITLAFDPSANTGRTLRYAYTGTVGAHPGPTTGPRGNVKDSDTTVGYNGDVLVNWLCHDTQPVP